MTDYRKLKYEDLKDECIKRGFIFKKGNSKRSELIDFLKENIKIGSDECDKLLPRIYKDYGTLAIGLGKNIDIELVKKYILFTASGDTKYDTILWSDIIISKKVPHKTFNTILIHKAELFFPGNLIKEETTLDFRKLNSILHLLDIQGDLLIDNATHYEKKIIEYLVNDVYQNIGFRDIKIDSVNKKFHIFRKGTGIKTSKERINELLGRSVSKVENNNSIILKNAQEIPKNTIIQKQEQSIENEIKEINNKKKKTLKFKPKQYKKNDLQITLLKKEDLQKDKITSSITITLSQFCKEINNKEFISNFINSIKNLYDYQIIFYDRQKKKIQSEYTQIKEKIRRLRFEGVTDDVIKNKYPMYENYSCFLVDLDDIIKTILNKKKELNEEHTQKNLFKAINHETKGFAALVGRDKIKDQIISILYAFSKSYTVITESFGNIAMLGRAGSGKTALAKIIGYIFLKSGILFKKNIKIVSRADLVGRYIGWTAPLVRGILYDTLGGILFIDEAYQLTPQDPARDFGPEAITEIVNFVDKYIGMSIIIVAGYEDLMKKYFFTSNEGLSRRFPYQLVLEDYTISQLTDILIKFIEDKIQCELCDDLCNYLYTVIFLINKVNPEIFENQAGDMLNLGTSIVKTIYSSYNLEWKNDNLKSSKKIIDSGVNTFLDLKGYIFTR